MAIREQGNERFKLPIRSRPRQAAQVDLIARLELIDRVAELSGIHVNEHIDATVPCRVDVMLVARSSMRLHNKATQQKLCSLSCEGVTVYGLDKQARCEVVSRGWGELDLGAVRVGLPRDSKELESVWSIIKWAYDGKHISSDSEPGTHLAATWVWPKFSRTSLQ
jgi:hypothetical protein